MSTFFSDLDSPTSVSTKSSGKNSFFNDLPPEKKFPGGKTGRIATQFALGRAEMAALPYELSVAPLASKDAQTAEYRKQLFEDIEQLAEQKMTGQWTAKDEELFQHLQDQIKNPQKAEKYVKTADIGIRGLAEKATGIDLHPEGVLEKAANWTGFIKNPAKLADLKRAGVTVKDVIKTISPTGQETLRGLGAGTGLQLAEEGNLGPIGTMAAAVVGDIMGGGVPGAVKAILNPKKSLANVASKLTPKNKLDLQKSIIKDFREAGIQADIGTLTNSPLVKWTQARLSASGLTGESLDNFRKEMMQQIKNEYKAVADSVGEARFLTMQEAAESGKETLVKIRDAEKSTYKKFYDKSTNRLTDKATVESGSLARSIENIEKKLSPGSLKSEEQTKVLKTLETLKSDLMDAHGNLKPAKVKDLVNNKIALGDIIDWEVQGGQKQLLKEIVEELDKAIISYGKKDLLFAKNYVSANKKFAEHAKTFRNQNLNKILRSEDPASLLNRMNSAQGIKDVKNALSKTAEGKEMYDSLARLKLDQIMQKNMVDGVSEQLKMGKFSNILEVGKNREIIQQLIPSESYKRLIKLQKSVGKLAESAQKFFNASKSGTTIIDAGFIGKAMMDVLSLLHGNVWPLMKTGGIYGGTIATTKLISNPTFLKYVEEAILASGENNISKMAKIAEKMIPLIKAAEESEAI